MPAAAAAAAARSLRFRSLRGRLILLWCLFAVAAAIQAVLLTGLYRQSAGEQVRRSAVTVRRGADEITRRFAFYAAGWETPPTDFSEPRLQREITVLVQLALGDLPGIEGGVWRSGGDSIAYAYPTYEGSGAKTDVPEAERVRIASVVERAVREQRRVEDRLVLRRETIVLVAEPLNAVRGVAAWTMGRVFTEGGGAYTQLLAGMGVLLGFLLLSGAVLGWLTLSWSRRLGWMETALAEAGEELPTLPSTGERDLDRIVVAINAASARLAAARKRHDELVQAVTKQERLAVLGRMAAGIAHEIRNPIGAMRLKAENAVGRAGERQERALRDILRHIARLDLLLGDLLTMTHPVRPTADLVEMTSFLADRIELHGEEAARRNVRLTFQSRISIWPLDRRRMAQVIDNLILNALQNTPPGGRVHVEALASGDAVLRLVVRDTGPGIPAEIAPHLFEPFVTGRADGTGLGLAIVREIVTAHGGTIRAINTESGGAQLEIDLPWRRSSS